MKAVISTVVLLLLCHGVRAECQDNQELLEENFRYMKAQSDLLLNKFLGLLVILEMQDQTQQEVKKELKLIKLEMKNIMNTQDEPRNCIGPVEHGEVLERFNGLYTFINETSEYAHQRECDAVPTTTEPTTTEPANAISSDFDEGFIGQRLFFSKAALSWHDARESCSAHNMTLAVLSNPSEFQEYATRKYGGKRFWLGGSDIASEGVWVWNDGSALGDQFPWSNGQPDDHRGAEDCLESGWIGYFNDAVCTIKFRYVCEQGSNSSA